MGMTPPPPLPPPSKPASQQKSQAVPAKEAAHSGPTGAQKTTADHKAPSASPKLTSISKGAASASETTAVPAASTYPQIKDPKSTPPAKNATPVPPCESSPLGPTSLPVAEPLQPELCLKHPEVAYPELTHPPVITHPELLHPPEAAVASSESDHSADSPLTEVDTPPPEPPAAPAPAGPSPESTGSSTSTDTSAELSSSPKVDAATPGHVSPVVAHTLQQATVTGPLEANIDSLYEPSLPLEVADPSKDTAFHLESITAHEPTLPHEAISLSESSADFSDSQSASTESAASQIPSPLFEPTPTAVEAAGHPQPVTDSVQTTTVPSVVKHSPEDVTVITKETPPPNPVTSPEKPTLVPMLSSHPESRTVSLEAVTAPSEHFLTLASTASPTELELAHHKSADLAEALLYYGPAHPHEASDVLPEEAGAAPPPGRVLSRTTSIVQPSEGTEEEIKIEGAPLEDIDTAAQRITSSLSDMTNLETSALTTSKVQLSRTDNYLYDDRNEEKDWHSPRTVLVSPESHHTHAMPGEVQQDEQSLPSSHRKLKVNDAITSGAQFYDSVKDNTVAETSTVLQGVQENLSISDEEEVKRKSITERHLDLHKDEKGDMHWQKHKQEERKDKEGGTSGQSKKLVKTTSISYDEAEERPSEKQDHEYSSTLPYKDVGPVQKGLVDDELESLPNSPEDRSKGEGSSSFHASSFTPGTSPTSVSSMDEDSDSSPSHKKLSEQSKQRKARHRQHGHILPTIEDSSEEEELREEELLREQDRWGDMDQQHLAKRGSSRKSKKGKEEMCSERRGEHPAAPLRNLSPIEDASPTQELRQSEEMEKLHRSPADSSGIEPKSAECRASQIPTVQKIREPSLHSVVEEKPKRRTKDQVQIVIPEQGTGTLSVHEKDKKSPEEYEGMPQEGKNSMLKELEPKPTQQISEHLQEIVILPPVSNIFSVAVSPSDTEKHENTVIVDAAIMGLMSQQSTIATPAASPTQAVSHSPQLISSKDGVTEKLKTPVHASGQNDYVDSSIYSDISLTKTAHLIPDLKITQCSSAEEDVEGDQVTEKQDIVPLSDAPQILQQNFKDKQSFMISDSNAEAQTADEIEHISVVCEMPKPTVTACPAPLPISVTTYAGTEPVSMICVPLPVSAPSPAETQNLVKAGAPPLAVALPPVPTTSELNPLSAVCLVAQTRSSSTSPSLPFRDSNISLHPTSVLALDPTPASTSIEMEPISVISEVPKVKDNPAPHSTCISAPGPASFLPPVLPPAEIEPLTVVCEVPHAKDSSAPQVKDTSASSPLALDLSAASTEISASNLHPCLEKAPPTLPPVMAQVTIFVPTTVPSPELKSSLELVTVSNASVPAAQVTASSSQPAPPPCPSPLNLSTYMHSVVVDIQRGVKDSMKATDVERSVAPPQSETISNTFTTKSYAMPPLKSSTKEHVVISVPSLDTDSLITHSSQYVKPVDSPVCSAVVGVTSLPAITLYSSSPPRIGSTPGALITSSVRTAPPSPVALLSYSSRERVNGPLKTQSLPSPYQPQPPFSLKDMPPVCTAPPPPAIISPTGPLALSKPITMAHVTKPVRDLSTSYSMYRPQVPPPILSPIPDRLPVNIQQEEALSPHYKYTVSQPPITSSTFPTSPHSISALSLNLSTSPEYQMNAASPKSPRTPRSGSSLNGAYVVITLPSQPNSPTESITTQVSTNKCEVFQTKMAHPTFDAPSAFTPFTQYTKSVEHQEMHGGHMAVSVSGQPASFPNLVTQVVTTEVQRTMFSLICERLPPSPTPRSPSIAISIPSEMATKVQLKPKENGTVPYSGDVVDLRTLKISIPMTEKGMDLSSLDSRRQSFSSDSSGRPTSAVHSAIVNLSAAASPVPTLSFVTDSITVTCSATVTPSSVMDRPLTHASVFSTPLPLTTSKTFEPVAQIIYRPLDSKPMSSFCIDTPINLSLGAITGIETSKSPIGDVPVSMTNGTMCIETGVVGAVDLTKTKPVQTVVTLEESTSEVHTTVIEDDPQPVDLTGGRRAVCCDMVYKLPFAGICTTPQPAPALPEDRFGYRDDHYQYNRSGSASSKAFCGMKPSMSDTNLSEAGLFFYKSKNSYDYYNGPMEGAVDLSSGKMSTGQYEGIADLSLKYHFDLPPLIPG